MRRLTDRQYRIRAWSIIILMLALFWGGVIAAVVSA